VPALAMMSMVDRLAAGALVRAPGRKVVGLRNVRVHRWLSFAAGAQRVKTLGRPVGSDTVAMQLLVWEEERSRFALVASGDVIMTEHWQLAGRPWESLAAGQPEPNPYATGVLFHGPAYQLLTDLQIERPVAPLSGWTWTPVACRSARSTRGCSTRRRTAFPTMRSGAGVRRFRRMWQPIRWRSPAPILRADAGQRPRALRGALRRLPGRRPPLPHDPRADHHGR
jgi:hypothetical protein